MSMDDTYVFEDSEKGVVKETQDEIDAFERRLRGEAAPPTSAPHRSGQKEVDSKLKQKPGAKAGSTYVQNAVKPKKLTEEQEEDAEAREALAELDKFDQKLG